MRLTYASWLTLMAILVSACNLAPTTPSATPTPEPILKLRIADGVSPPAALPQSVLSLAAQQGFFLKEGLDAEIISVNGSTINFLALGIPNIRVQALVANQIAATTTTVGTWVTIQHAPGVKVLVQPEDFWNTAPLMSNTSAATVGVVRDKAEALRRYTRAMLQTARYYAQHKEEWVRDMGTLRPDIQANDLSDLWDQFKSAWAVNGQLNLTTFQKTSDYLYATDDF